MRVASTVYPWTSLAVLLWVGAPVAVEAQDGPPRRLDRLLDSPPFDRATWGVYVTDHTGQTLYARNPDRLFVPASNIKLVVAAAASTLLPPDHRIITSVYGTGPLRDGGLKGDLVIYGRGDPTFSERCYGVDTLAPGVCDDLWTRIDDLADSIVHRGIRQVDGGIVGDGSYFEQQLVHPAWESYDLNWWYAAPVSGLGFNDNSVNVTWGPGPRVRAPPRVEFEPMLDNFTFENRARTVQRRGRRTIDFFREPGTMNVWAEGTVPLGHPGKTEYFALPDPNLYFVQALRAALEARGVSIAGPTSSTTDSLRYRGTRMDPALVEFSSRPLADRIFPILNSSQNWFAEMFVKTLGREIAGDGSWDAGLEVERRFLIDSVGIDSTAFELDDASGLSSGNLITPRALAQLLRYVHVHPRNAAFLHALPRSGAPGSLEDRFENTPLAGRVVAKTGSINHVNALSGYIDRPGRSALIFSVIANNHAASYARALRQIDAVVLEIGKAVSGEQ
jgi:D-alanyl-D-alanine carboxypeptidase/D-alanyl-D-alanine-endopeptidase (penicillin-binding protein 4)